MLKQIICLLAIVELVYSSLFGPWRYVKVIQFQSDDSNQYIAPEENPNTLEKTKDFTLCFRFMTRFFSSYKLFQTNHWYMTLKNDMEFSGYLNFRPINTSLADGFSKMFLLKPYVPGKWVSLCLGLKLSESGPEMTLVQDGNIELRKTFSGGDFEWFYYSRNMSIQNL